MNQQILKRLDNAISSTLIGKSKDPDCNVGAAISVIHKGQEVFRNEYGMADKEKKIPMAKDSIFRCSRTIKRSFFRSFIVFGFFFRNVWETLQTPM